MSADMRPSDDWIDETAQELTEGEPAADFKARVLARIEETPVRGFAWRGWAMASAGVVIVVLAFVVPGLRGPADTPTNDQVRLKPDPANARDAAELRLPSAPSVVEGPAPRVAEGPSRPQRYGGPGRPDTPPEVEPDVPEMENAPPPIEVADIDMRPLDILPLAEADPMAADDIPITSIELAPLESTMSQFD